VGESPSESVEREVKEESGFDVRAVRLLALWDRDKHPPTRFHIYKLIFQCELLGGDPLTTSMETEGVDFFPKDALPELSLSCITPGRSKGSSNAPPPASNRRISTSSSALSGARMTFSPTRPAQRSRDSSPRRHPRQCEVHVTRVGARRRVGLLGTASSVTYCGTCQARLAE